MHKIIILSVLIPSITFGMYEEELPIPKQHSYSSFNSFEKYTIEHISPIVHQGSRSSYSSAENNKPVLRKTMSFMNKECTFKIPVRRAQSDTHLTDHNYDEYDSKTLLAAINTEFKYSPQRKPFYEEEEEIEEKLTEQCFVKKEKKPTKALKTITRILFRKNK